MSCAWVGCMDNWAGDKGLWETRPHRLRNVSQPIYIRMDIKRVNRIIFVLTAEDNLPFCYESERGYHRSFKQECLTMYVNGMGLRAIERVKGVDRTTVMDWIEKVGSRLPDYYNPEQIPAVGELDELETVGSKKAGASFGGNLRM